MSALVLHFDPNRPPATRAKLPDGYKSIELPAPIVEKLKQLMELERRGGTRNYISAVGLLADRFIRNDVYR